MQIFAEMPPDPPEEIFVVFIFVGCAHRTTPLVVLTYTTSRDTRWVKNFVVFIFAVLCRSAKTAKICTPRKFPAIRYVLLRRARRIVASAIFSRHLEI